MSKLKVRLFVESVEASAEGSSTKGRTPAGKGRWVAEPGMIGGRGKVYEEPFGPLPSQGSESGLARGAHDFVLPAEQREAVEIVRRVASKAGLDFKVVDVGKMNVLHRAIQKEFGRIRRFPTLVLSSGKRIEGNMTEQQVIQLLPGTAKKERRLFPAYTIPPKYNAFFKRAKSSALPFYEKLIVFLRFVFFLEKNPKHGTMQNETLMINLEVIFVVIVLPLSVLCLFIWVYYGFAVCLASVALISFALLEIFHVAFDR
jgi:hypothetical protein